MKAITLDDMVTYYKQTPKFSNLSVKTQKDYQDQCSKVCATLVQNNTRLGGMKINKISLRHASSAYDGGLQVGTRTANMRLSVLSIILKYAMQKELLGKNPLIGLSRKKDSIRKIMWNKNDVKKFLDVGYSKMKYRSISLICHLSYDFGQRIGDMRTLKWDNINFEERRVDLTQSKRGAEVHLPIHLDLLKMLRQQKEDFGFQDYVCPRPLPIRGQSYTPYSMQEISYLVNDIKKEANLCPTLQAMDLRRTAITEMVEAGVDIAGIMQVSGHQNPQSVKPYLVNTFSGASQALSKRNSNG